LSTLDKAQYVYWAFLCDMIKYCNYGKIYLQ